MVDKNSKVPLHYQVYLDLLRQIQIGTYKRGDKIPTEPQLEEMYDVSRVTVRRAVEMLAQEGIVEKHRGKRGTVVTNAKHDYDIRMLTSFSDDVRQYGERPSSELISFGLVTPPKRVADCLGIQKGERAYSIDRKRLRSDEVVGVHLAYIRCLDGLVLCKDDFTPEASLYAMLRERGVVPATATETIEVRKPEKGILDILGLPEGTAVFYKERVTFDHEGSPFEYVEMYYNPDSYRYRVELSLD
jgi:GntR family transcriptional regulator